MFEIALKDVITMGTTLVLIVAGFFKLKSDIRHLEDIKIDIKSHQKAYKELNAILTEISLEVATIKGSLPTDK